MGNITGTFRKESRDFEGGGFGWINRVWVGGRSFLHTRDGVEKIEVLNGGSKRWW